MTQYPKQTNDGLPTEERILWISGALGLLVAFLLTAAVVFTTVGTSTFTAGYVPVALVFTALLVVVVFAMRRLGTKRQRPR
jgi:membrane protein implicated in regulation of membrane protease activity